MKRNAQRVWESIVNIGRASILRSLEIFDNGNSWMLWVGTVPSGTAFDSESQLIMFRYIGNGLPVPSRCHVYDPN